jgi:hypothetical protein
MSAEEFYEEFKAALDFLGAGFHGKDQVEVHFNAGKFCMVRDGKEARVSLPITDSKI